MAGVYTLQSVLVSRRVAIVFLSVFLFCFFFHPPADW